MAINSADNGVTGYNIPDMNVGFGRIDLDNVLYFPGDARKLLLVDNTTGLGQGQYIEYQVNVVDATQPLEVYARARQEGLYDLVVNCASLPGTEMASILAARDGGEVLFFNMATSFTAAALGAEGAGKDVRLTIGNGYARGHAELALDLVRSTPALQRLFAARVG